MAAGKKALIAKLKVGFVSLLALLSFSLSACVPTTSGLQSYVDSAKGYQFLYPNGWVPVEVQGASKGVSLVFRDIIERAENLSLIVSDIPEGKTLETLGTPTEVGYRFLKQTNADAPEGRTTEFLRAGSYQVKDKPYYILEYAVEQPNVEKRHNLATVAVNRGKLYTFNLSTDEERWERVKEQFETVATSFSVD